MGRYGSEMSLYEALWTLRGAMGRYGSEMSLYEALWTLRGAMGRYGSEMYLYEALWGDIDQKWPYMKRYGH